MKGVARLKAVLNEIEKPQGTYGAMLHFILGKELSKFRQKEISSTGDDAWELILEDVEKNSYTQKLLNLASTMMKELKADFATQPRTTSAFRQVVMDLLTNILYG